MLYGVVILDRAIHLDPQTNVFTDTVMTIVSSTRGLIGHCVYN